MSTTLFYNGVTLNDCWTKSFTQRLEMDESNTDLLYHIFTVRVQSIAIANPDAGLGAIPRQTPQNAVDALAQLHAQLMHPRGDFRYDINGVVLLKSNADPRSLDRDVNNGPKPRDLDITHIAGSKAIRIEFEIEIAKVVCGPNVPTSDRYGNPVVPGNTRQVLNNRWSLEDTLDEDFFMTRTWDGTLRVAHSHFSPSNYRQIVIPPLQAGYKRMMGKFIQSRDGLQLRYKLTDKQVHAAPPPPATRWKAHYSEGATAGGAKGHAEVQVTLWGPPGASKRDLLTTALRVTETRLGNIRKNFAVQHEGNGKVFLNSATVTEHLDTNSVSVNLRVTRVADARKYLNLEVKDRFGRFLDEGRNRIRDYDHLSNPVPDTYDSNTPAGYFAAYLQTPCDEKHGLPNKLPIPKEGRSPGEDNEEPDYRTYTTSEYILDDARSPVSEEQSQNVYTHIELESEYQTRRGWYGMPVALWDPDASESGETTDGPENAATAKVVKLHQPITRRLMRITAERVGTWPELPEPEEVVVDPNEITETLVYDKIKLDAPELMADGNVFLFRAGGFYVYQLSRTPTAQEKLMAGARQDQGFTPETTTFDGAKHFTSGKITVADEAPPPEDEE